VIIFPFDQSLRHREFPHGGGLPSPTDLPGRASIAWGRRDVNKMLTAWMINNNVLKSKANEKKFHYFFGVAYKFFT
jgi:hypothetical protein